MEPVRRTLVVTDGSLASLVAAWTEGVCRGSGGVVLYVPPAAVPPGPAGERTYAAIRRQAELCQAAEVLEPAGRWNPPASPGAGDRANWTGASWSVGLLDAALEAVARGIGRVVWPIHAGGSRTEDIDLDTVADACDRAMLVSQLVGIDSTAVAANRRGEAGTPTPAGEDMPGSPAHGRGHALGGGGVKIETPYIDLTDAQLADLALDLDAPVSSARWCLGAGERPCGGCDPCRRWSKAFEGINPQPRTLSLAR